MSAEELQDQTESARNPSGVGRDAGHQENGSTKCHFGHLIRSSPFESLGTLSLCGSGTNKGALRPCHGRPILSIHKKKKKKMKKKKKKKKKKH